MLILPLALAACFLDGAGRPLTEFTAEPQYICPNDSSELSWDVPAEDPCYEGRPQAGIPTPCSTVVSLTNDAGDNYGIDLYDRRNSITVYPSWTTTYTLMSNVIVRGRGIFADTLSQTVHVVGLAEDMTFTAKAVCDLHENIEIAQLLSSCVEVNEICIAEDNPEGTYTMSVIIPSGIQQEFNLSPGDCVTPTDFDAPSFEGLSRIHVTYNTGRGSVPMPGDGITRDECREFKEDINLELSSGCTGAYEGCFASTSDPIISEPPDDDADNGLVPICDLDATCGNGTCDQGCETDETCPEDCAVTEAPECVDDGFCSADEATVGNCTDCLFFPTVTPVSEECVDDGICTEGEQAKGSCRDCSGDQCGVPCSGTCSSGLPCVNGVCWEASVCDPNASDSSGGDDGGEPPPDDPVCVNDGVCTEDERGANCRDCRNPGGGNNSSGGGGNPCPCNEVCLQWNFSANPATCMQYGYQDCNGNTCQP